MLRLRIPTLQPITCIGSLVFVALHFCRTGPNTHMPCLLFRLLRNVDFHGPGSIMDV